MAKQIGNALKGLGLAVDDLARGRHRRNQRDAEQFERLARKILPPQAAAELALKLAGLEPDPNADKPETFIMLTASQNAEVVRWIDKHSKRRNEAKSLWAELFTAVHPSTGEVMLSRSVLAARIGTDADNVSRIMAELATINAIRREKMGREVRYFMNSSIATHIASADARAEARKKDGGLRLVHDAAQTEREALEQAGQMRLV